MGEKEYQHVEIVHYLGDDEKELLNRFITVIEKFVKV